MMACSAGAGVLMEGGANRARSGAARTNLRTAWDLLTVRNAPINTSLTFTGFPVFPPVGRRSGRSHPA